MITHNRNNLIGSILLLLSVTLIISFGIFLARQQLQKPEIAISSGTVYLDNRGKKVYLESLKQNDLKSSIVFNADNGFEYYNEVKQNPDTHIALNDQGKINSIYNLKGIDILETDEILEPVVSADNATGITSRFFEKNYGLFDTRESVVRSLNFESSENENLYYSVAPQYFKNSIPVQGAFANTLLAGSDDNSTKLLSASANLYNIPENLNTNPAITSGEAIQWLIDFWQWDKSSTETNGAQLVILPYKNQQSNQTVYILTWHFNISRSFPVESHEVWIDARNTDPILSGDSCLDRLGKKTRLCQKRSLIAEGSVQGNIGAPQSRLVGFPDLTIPGNGQSDTEGNFSGNNAINNLVLSGKHVIVFQRSRGGMQSKYSGPADINLDSSMELDERTVYYSISRVRDYWEKERGLLFGTTQPVPAIVRSDEVNMGNQKGCNAFYQFDRDIMQFGSTCATPPLNKNLGEYQSISSHEYGHAMTSYVPNYNWIPGRDINFEISANEGWADYVACTVTGNPVIPLVGRSCQNNFSTINIASQCPPSPDGQGPEVHCAGQVFSGALWDAHQKIGQETFDRVVAKAQNIGGVLDSYEAFLRNLLIADDTDNNPNNGSPHCGSITTAFRQHGIQLPNLTCVDSGGGNGNSNSTNQNQNSVLVQSVSLSAVPVQGNVPLTVNFTLTLKNFNQCPADLSLDTGDNAVNQITGNCGSNNPVLPTQTMTQIHTYTSPGNFQARVKVGNIFSSPITINVASAAGNGNRNMNRNENMNGNQNRNENQNRNDNNNSQNRCELRGDVNCDNAIDQTDLAIVYNFIVNRNISDAVRAIKNADVSECSFSNRRQENITDTDAAYYREFITNAQWPGSCN